MTCCSWISVAPLAPALALCALLNGTTFDSAWPNDGLTPGLPEIWRMRKEWRSSSWNSLLWGVSLLCAYEPCAKMQCAGVHIQLLQSQPAGQLIATWWVATISALWCSRAVVVGMDCISSGPDSATASSRMLQPQDNTRLTLNPKPLIQKPGIDAQS